MHTSRPIARPAAVRAARRHGGRAVAAALRELAGTPIRVERLLKRGLITHDQAETFMRDGAIGSHLENLERNDGFKGFNQQGVSEIIARTDPRRQRGGRAHGVGA